MVKSNAKVDHGIGQQAEAFTDFFEPIIADDQFAVGVLPTKSPFHFVTLLVELTVEPAELASDGDGLLGVSGVRINHRDQPMLFDQGFVLLGIKPGIQGQSGSLEIQADALSKLPQVSEGFGQDHHVMVVDGLDGEGSQDEAMIVDDGKLFVAFLVFVARVADAGPPFFTTMFEPSPWRIETSSCPVSLRWIMESSKSA